jgi:hypothetical protein
MPETKDEEIASLEAKLAASEGQPGYGRRVEAIKKRLNELRDAH